MNREPKRIATGVYRVGMGGVNVFLVDLGDDGLVLVDAGIEKDAKRIGRAILALGRKPDELRAVVVTHLHRDHIGGLQTVKDRTGAEVWMHPADAGALREGIITRELEAGPGRLRGVVARQMNRWPAKRRAPIAVEHEVLDGDTLPFGDLRAIHTPGHSAGHLSLLLPRDGGVLFVGDAASNWLRLGHGPIYEDIAEAERSLRALGALDFEVAAFAHGRTITAHAAERFRERWPGTD